MMSTAVNLQNLDYDVFFLLCKFLDLGDQIRLKRAKGEPIPKRKYIRKQVRLLIEERDHNGLQSLLKEENGFDQYARLYHLDVCMNCCSFDCYIVLRKHFARYKIKKAIGIPKIRPDENSLGTDPCKRLVRFLCSLPDHKSYYESSYYNYVLYPLHGIVVGEKLEKFCNDEKNRAILGDKFLEEMTAYMEECKAYQRNTSGGLLQLFAIGAQDIYIT